ncbi:MAG: YggS family pyridoxal phosphate-dependent enzyme [Alphaproteobacteria bacterium]|nr:MAG: YggS family pyridoxal phosphate-dependent enzyme [Alphaproteobacteria bacterium]
MVDEKFTYISNNYHTLQCEIATVAQEAQRPIPRLLAVTKQQPQEKIDALIALGHRFFAENKVQEAKLHWEHHPMRPHIELHCIGHLQRNKVRDAVALFDVIETVDRASLVDAVAQEATRLGKHQRIMIQVNIGKEPQKSGVDETHLDALVMRVRTHSSLALEGLMCVPPVDTDPTEHFIRLHTYAQHYALPYCSMGMSNDYRTAIRCGATHVRIGSALLGERGGL